MLAKGKMMVRKGEKDQQVRVSEGKENAGRYGGGGENRSERLVIGGDGATVLRC